MTLSANRVRFDAALDMSSAILDGLRRDGLSPTRALHRARGQALERAETARQRLAALMVNLVGLGETPLFEATGEHGTREPRTRSWAQRLAALALVLGGVGLAARSLRRRRGLASA